MRIIEYPGRIHFWIHASSSIVVVAVAGVVGRFVLFIEYFVYYTVSLNANREVKHKHAKYAPNDER